LKKEEEFQKMMKQKEDEIRHIRDQIAVQDQQLSQLHLQNLHLHMENKELYLRSNEQEAKTLALKEEYGTAGSIPRKKLDQLGEKQFEN
jgi:hypothetical protein